MIGFRRRQGRLLTPIGRRLLALAVLTLIALAAYGRFLTGA